MVDLTVVMPAYNEADNLPEAVEDISKYVLAIVPNAEVLVVNDGSTDKTAEVLGHLAEAEPRLQIITQPNAGHGAALMTGISKARGGAVLLLDSDREVPLSSFSDHWAALRDPEVGAILGVRVSRKSPWHRACITTAMRVLIRLLFGVRLGDANAPYKLISADALSQIKPLIPEDCHIPSVAAAIALKHLTGPATREVDVRHTPRTAGQSTLKIRRLATLCAKATGDLFRVRSALRRR
ncbi:MAG: glycosyltransferase family 2 protein [Pseudomonadota bacterium]